MVLGWFGRVVVRRFAFLVVALAAVVVLGAAGLAIYAAAALSRFERVEARRSIVLYAAPPVLTTGVHVGALDLAGILGRVGYREARGAPGPGQFSRSEGAWDIHVPGPEDRRVRLTVSGGRITRLQQGGAEARSVALPPEVLASAGADMGENIRPVRLPDLPATLRDAILVTEDVRFYEHGGVDPRGILRALWTNVRKGRVAEGGSTITQQLVKSRLLNPERTLVRKANEALLSTALEWRYSKDQILEAYINEIYLGQRGGAAVRGVGAAALVYFGKEVHQLTLAEAALIAGMIRGPNSYSPANNPERARERRDVVLTRLRDLGRISEADYRRARKEPVRARAAPAASGLVAPYFVDYVRAELERNPDLDLGDQHGVRVYTTLDPVLQRLAESAVVKGMDRLETARPRLRRRGPEERLQAAMVVLDPVTGQVRALVGGRDYRSSQYNRAVLARRQPGSAFKPFVYLTALAPRKEGGPAFTAASLIEDAPITLMVDGKPWTPKNYDDRYEGAVTVRRALEGSLNTAAVRLTQAVGPAAVVETAALLGMELKPVPAVALGVFEITPLQLARAYLPLVNSGLASAGGVVEAVADEGGRALWSASRESRPVIGAAEAYLVTSLLEGVINAGTGAAARAVGVPGAVAGKTGTTNDGRDAWFVGYSPNLLALVWVGFDDGTAAGLSGSEGALPIWSEFMRQALEIYPGGAFAEPTGVTRVKVDVTTGRRATTFCPHVATEVFLTGTEPPACEEHGGVVEEVVRWWDRIRGWLRK